MNHSPEPWSENDTQQIVDSDGGFVADWCIGGASCEELGDYITPENRKRIIACVNACKDIPTDQLLNEELILVSVPRKEWT